MKTRKLSGFSHRILRWFDRHGRKDLPWQKNPTPYRVWVSEIMLQQTRVSSVIPYYTRFMQRFSSLRKLADAPLDEVLHHWSGLGYYARARNLHRTAQILRDEHGGRFPASLEAVTQLPGIGRSTAGAILSLSRGEAHAILDGNVKRVLARHAGIEGWSGQPDVAETLWRLAEARTPNQRTAQYNQAMMDLGATLCVRGTPECERCPVMEDCVARYENRTRELPTPKPKKTLPRRETHMLILLRDAGRVLLEQRPPVGIWGGLWSFPEIPSGTDVPAHVQNQFALRVDAVETLPPVLHTFSHFQLLITPQLVRVKPVSGRVMDTASQVWYNIRQPDARGLAAPVQRLLTSL